MPLSKSLETDTSVNPLYPNTSIHISHTFLYKFPCYYKESVFDRKVGEFSGKPDELLRTNITTKPLEQQELRQVLEAAQSGLLNGITQNL